MGYVYVLRLGHRRDRDKRITTHVCLVARAFKAKGCLIHGDRDSICDTIHDIIDRWGGKYFKCSFINSWKKFIHDWKKHGGIVVHLTMYGINLPDIIEELRQLVASRDLLVVVGAEKVPREVYELSDYNVAITNQPHSEVAALAVFLDWLWEGKEFYLDFSDARIKIIPSKKGKNVVKLC